MQLDWGYASHIRIPFNPCQLTLQRDEHIPPLLGLPKFSGTETITDGHLGMPAPPL